MKSKIDKSGNLIFHGMTFVGYHANQIPNQVRESLDNEWEKLVKEFANATAKQLAEYLDKDACVHG